MVPQEQTEHARDRRIEKLWDGLVDTLRSAGGVVVAFSGGVDSTLLLAAASEALSDKALGVTARSETYPQREADEAARLAELMGVRHRFIVSEELDLPEFKENPRDRCYFCKRELFGLLADIAEVEGLAWVCDGSNADDKHDHRPGSRAAQELGVRSPLAELGFTKRDIRELSKSRGLPNWNKPSFACLSSRFPYGTPITREAVARIDRAEEELRSLGLRQLRLRNHGTVGRLEVPPEDFALLADVAVRRRAVDAIKRTGGFAYAAIDLEGYRTGSLNEPEDEVPA